MYIRCTLTRGVNGMRKGKLFKNEHGAILTVKDGHSIQDRFVATGVGSSNNEDSQQNAEELIKRWNSHDELVYIVGQLSAELNLAISEVNKHRETTINPQTETPPDYWDKESCFVADKLLHEISGATK